MCSGQRKSFPNTCNRCGCSLSYLLSGLTSLTSFFIVHCLFFFLSRLGVCFNFSFDNQSMGKVGKKGRKAAAEAEGGLVPIPRMCIQCKRPANAESFCRTIEKKHPECLKICLNHYKVTKAEDKDWFLRGLLTAVELKSLECLQVLLAAPECSIDQAFQVSTLIE